MDSRNPNDADSRLRDVTQQIREALHAVREGVVQAVMRRDALAAELAKRDQEIVDLDAKATLAERINSADIAGELREERDRKVAVRAQIYTELQNATASAESAKMQMPAEETRLLQQLNQVKADFGRLAAESLSAGRSEADDMLDRAIEKVRGLEREAGARQEVSGAVVSRAAERTAESVEQTAEQMLADLEKRMAGVSPAPARAAEPQPQAIRPTAPPIVAPKTTSSYRGEQVRMDPTQRVRVAGIGTGGIFRGAHMPAYPHIAQAQLVALCDPDPAAQALALKRYRSLYESKIEKATDDKDDATVERLKRDIDSVRVYDDISQVIAEVKPDLVDVCTQPLLHTPLSVQALDAGLNVMCEKPISRSWLETKRLRAVIQRSGKLYQHNENWLWDPDYYTAQKLIRAGAIGEPVFMFLTQAHGGPEGNPKFWNSDFGGGGSLLDNGIHAIGAVWYMSGLEKRPTVVKAAAPFGMQIRMPDRIIEGRFQKVRVDDDAHILIRFEDPDTGAWSTAHVEGSWSEQDSPDTLIQGTIGSIKYVNQDGKRYAVITDANGIETRRIGVSGPTWQFWPSSFYGEILNMVECVRNGVQSISSAEFGADCSAIVGASYLSQKNGKRAVTLGEFEKFANEIEARYPDDAVGADNALVDALLSAVR